MYFYLIEEETKKEERRRVAYEEHLKRRGIQNELEAVRSDCFSLIIADSKT